ncbi:PTS fructose IIA subunit family protein [Marinihelvus fidelis]|uniref:PTS fructose IIA subunit family protein n=1 Tax=Marinihelvus fidelis TaxID=2613842 RepID=A0A5N0THU3_9GAMM|nr:PTS fructose IIA subunit family protein [Marinihelvus fidelis]KAA9133426.1 PTS fructose IIA subunit family protein [Marinihelvus fidelis]
MSSVNLVLVTHEGIGSTLLAQARRILADELEGTVVVEVGYDEDIGSTTLEARIDCADSGAGVLVLTDVPGATPSNLAQVAAAGKHRVVVTGLNLPMLIRAWNYHQRPLEELAVIAVDGGRNAIGMVS